MHVDTHRFPNIPPEKAILPIAVAIAGVAGLAVPSLALPLAIASAAAVGLRISSSKSGRPPLRVPEPGPDEGRWYLGTHRDGGGQVWLNDADMLGHVAVFGTTGSGKTEFLVGVAANAAYRGGGFMFVDGKGDVAVYAKLQALAASCGRQGDLLVLNFLDATDAEGTQGHRFNPLATGDALALSRTVTAIMGGNWPENAKDDGIFLIVGIMHVLVHLRDHDEAEVGLRALSKHLEMDPATLASVITDGEGRRLPSEVTQRLVAYLSALPDGTAGTERHRRIAAPIVAKLGEMLNHHPRVLCEDRGDIVLTDVIGGHRMLAVLLPALGRSRDEVGSLGRMLVEALDGAMRTHRHGEANVPPFLCVLDELGYYAPGDLMSLSRVAGSAGVCLVMAAQDIHGIGSLGRGSGRHARPFGTSILMRIEDAETAQTAMSLANPHQPVTFRDIKGQKEGEIHLCTPDGVVRVRGLYANPVTLIDRRAIKLGPDRLVRLPRNPQPSSNVGGV